MKFRKTIRIMSKITVNRKDKALTNMELRHRYLPEKFYFLKLFSVVSSKKFMSINKQIVKISNKVTGNSIAIYRSSHRRCSVRKGVLRNFAKVTGKYLYQSLYFNKVRPATLLKQRLWRSFPMNFAKFLRTPFCRTRLGHRL